VKNLEISSTDYAIAIVYSPIVYLANNYLSYNQYGISIGASNESTIIGNTIFNSGYALGVGSSINVTITGNDIFTQGGSAGGIYSRDSSYVTISCNRVSRSGEGIFDRDSDNVTIKENYVSSNRGKGISQWGSSDVVISNNEISENGMGVETFGGSTNVVVHHNNFLNNSAQSADVDTNQWDNGYPSGGNFWSDWTSPDIMSGPNQDQSGADGIVDLPRQVDFGSSQDDYPLTSPVESPSCQVLGADAGPDQETNEGEVIELDGSASTGSTEEEYWDSFLIGADSFITSAPPDSVLATFTYGGTVYPAMVATGYGTGRAVYTEGSTFSQLTNLINPGNAHHQLFINSMKWATKDKDPASTNVLVTWGHRELVTYWTGTPGEEGSNVSRALEDAGYNVDTAHDVPSDLTGYDAVVMAGIGWSWSGWVNPDLWSGPGGTNTAHKPTPSEVTSLLNFVQNGGGLIASVEYQYGADWLQDVGNPMGVYFAAITFATPMTAYRTVDHPIFLKWGGGSTEIVSYEWDFTGDGTYDYIETATNAPDGMFDGKTTHVYGDNWVYSATLRITDETGATDTDTCNITVRNVAPTLETMSAHVDLNLTLRVAGEKWHDVRMTLFEDGLEIGSAGVVRYPGSPDRQSATIEGVYLDLTKEYSAKVVYTPDDDPINGQPKGANPVWIIMTFEDGSEERVHHIFNVNHPDTWVWDVDLNVHLVGHALTFEATATDPGSDDLTFEWEWGDGSLDTQTKYYNNAPSNTDDPLPSPWGTYPFAASDALEQVYAATGDYAIILTVMDDDGGTTSQSLTIVLS
jgi:parallel beta-helix repeat protein